MSEITNAEINKKAAEMLGLEGSTFHLADDRKFRVFDANGTRRRVFDIFATTPQGAADREAVVIALGEKHGIFIYPILDAEFNFCSFGWFNSMTEEGSKLIAGFNYQEALSAAVQAVK